MDKHYDFENILTMPALALRGVVFFPNSLVHFDVGRKKSIEALKKAMGDDNRVFVVSQKDIKEENPDFEGLYNVGIIARIKQIVNVKDDLFRILVEGECRAKIIDEVALTPYITATVAKMCEPGFKTKEEEIAAVRQCRNAFGSYAELNDKIAPDFIMSVATENDASKLCDLIAANIPIESEEKQRLLEMSTVKDRVVEIIALLNEESSIMSLEMNIEEKVKSSLDKNQKDYYLREQMKVISDELGEGESTLEEVDRYRIQLSKLDIPDETRVKIAKEINRLQKNAGSSQEAGVIRTYLEIFFSLPWNKSTKDILDIKKAQKVLDKSHFGLDKVKERILEIIAVKKLNPDIKGQIICLVGPPGVGKTSIANSIAKAMGKKFVRISLGGVRDEADIRGHRKTYIGAMPGRIINAVRIASSNNAVVLLDEIDKMGNDYKGDPSSALLEVLDSEQNSNFRDHYLEVPFDLGKLLFITTANDISEIPAPLYDRMDIISIDSYTTEEKFQITKKHLIPKTLKANGLDKKQISITNQAINKIIEEYTKEAGVRGIERVLSKFLRKAAKLIASGEETKVTLKPENIVSFLGNPKYKKDIVNKEDMVGVVTGLAWTAVGGVTMEIEAAVMDGTGKIELTGSLGDVMKESAKAAISYIRCNADKLSIKNDFYKTKDIHIHAPEGATPKDGPSAGVTMTTALVSALTNIPVKSNVAMTGEVTITGRVLPIGGLKEKSMAAYAAKKDTVIIPKDNQVDLADVSSTVKDNVDFIPVSKVDNVLKLALASNPFNKKMSVELDKSTVKGSNYTEKKATNTNDSKIIPQ